MKKNSLRLFSLLFVILFIVGLTNPLSPFEFGINLGSNYRQSGIGYGFTAGMGLIIPLLKIEIEIYDLGESGPNTFMLALKLKPKLGSISPYGVFGIGNEYQTFNLDFGNYKWIGFWGGGIHYYLNGMISLRIDGRLLHYRGEDFFRFTGGFFIHI